MRSASRSRSAKRAPRRPAHRVALTLDANIQQRVEAVLDAVAHAFKPTDATAIVMDPRTGAILAQANWPFFNPALPDRDATAEMREPRGRLRLRTGLHLQAGDDLRARWKTGLSPRTRCSPCPGAIQVAERVIHDDTEHGVEDLTVSQILARSSNVGTIEIAQTEGTAPLRGWVARYGFGSRPASTSAGEESGLTLKLSQYSGSSMGNLPIGQGELVTPMQMATAYSAIANGGILRPPHVVAAINGRPVAAATGPPRDHAAHRARDPPDARGRARRPKARRARFRSPATRSPARPAPRSKIDPTTHEYSETKFVASFIGFAPALHPKLLTAVVVDEPTAGSIYGGHVAAPAFGEIMALCAAVPSIPPGLASPAGRRLDFPAMRPTEGTR